MAATEAKPVNKKHSGLGAGPRPLIGAWLHHHRVSAADSLHKLIKEPISTFLTWLVVGIALALPAALMLVVDNVQTLASDLQRPAQVSLFLSDDTDLAQAQKLAQGIEARAGVASVILVPKDDALAQFAADSGLEPIVETLTDNPLPHTLLVRPVARADGADYEAFAKSLERVPGVEQVVLDTQWLDRLASGVDLGRKLVLGFGGMMILGTILILGNTIRLAIEARREEIVVIKLIGAGDAFTRRPFLYTGLWFGIGGGVFAAGLVAGMLVWVAPPVNALLALYDSANVLIQPGLVGYLNLILIGGFLGLVSAFIAAGTHLKKVEPH